MREESIAALSGAADGNATRHDATVVSAKGSAIEIVLLAAANAMLFFCLAITMAYVAAADKSLAQLALVVSFIATLAAAALSGWIGDVFGRKPVIIFALLLTSVVAFGIAAVLWKTLFSASMYPMIGLWALQQFACAGGSTQIATSLFEMAPTQKKGLFTSAFTTSGTVGGLLAVLTSLGLAQLRAAGWRGSIVVVLSAGSIALLLAVSIWYNNRETLELFPTTEKSGWSLRDNRWTISKLLFIFACVSAFSYFIAFIISDGKSVTPGVNFIVPAALAVPCTLVAGLLSGWIVDRFGGRVVMLASGLIFLSLSTVALLDSAMMSDATVLTFFIVTSTVLAIVFETPAQVRLAMAFPGRLRGRGIAFTRGISSAAVMLLMGPGGRPLLLGDVIVLLCIGAFGIRAAWVSWPDKVAGTAT